MQENLLCLVGKVGGSTSHWKKKPQRQHLTGLAFLKAKND